jgi:hypothetical protein
VASRASRRGTFEADSTISPHFLINVQLQFGLDNKIKTTEELTETVQVTEELDEEQQISEEVCTLKNVA